MRASLSEVAEDGLHQAHNYAHAAISITSSAASVLFTKYC